MTEAPSWGALWARARNLMIIQARNVRRWARRRRFWWYRRTAARRARIEQIPHHPLSVAALSRATWQEWLKQDYTQRFVLLDDLYEELERKHDEQR